jgi:hypothetical protein
MSRPMVLMASRGAFRPTPARDQRFGSPDDDGRQVDMRSARAERRTSRRVHRLLRGLTGLQPGWADQYQIQYQNRRLLSQETKHSRREALDMPGTSLSGAA